VVTGEPSDSCVESKSLKRVRILGMEVKGTQNNFFSKCVNVYN